MPPLREAGAARGRHDGHVRRLVVVLPPLHRPARRERGLRPPRRRLLDAGRPVHRRHRSREGAPALLALLHEGAERPRADRRPRAVPAAVPPGLGAARRQAYVEVAGRRHTRRADRSVRRRPDPYLHPLPGTCRSGHRLDARRDRGDRPLRPPPLADRPRGGYAARVAARRRHATRAQGARDDRPRHRRHRSPVRLQHADRGGDGARERAVEVTGRSGRALRRRDGRLADAAVRPARCRGAVDGARARASLGGAVAGRRRVACSNATRSSWSCR